MAFYSLRWGADARGIHITLPRFHNTTTPQTPQLALFALFLLNLFLLYGRYKFELDEKTKQTKIATSNYSFRKLLQKRNCHSAELTTYFTIMNSQDFSFFALVYSALIIQVISYYRIVYDSQSGAGFDKPFTLMQEFLISPSLVCMSACVTTVCLFI